MRDRSAETQLCHNFNDCSLEKRKKNSSKAFALKSDELMRYRFPASSTLANPGRKNDEALPRWNIFL